MAMREPALTAAGVIGPRALGGAAAAQLVSMYPETEFAARAHTMASWVDGVCAVSPAPKPKFCGEGAVTNATRRAVAIVTDMLFTSTAELVAGALAARGLHAYRYLFGQVCCRCYVASLSRCCGAAVLQNLDPPECLTTISAFS